jgi:uncharacterized protein (TIGR00725 family)
VVGPGGDGLPERWLSAAEAVGRGLALAGHPVVTGGLGGVMAAAARGAARAGGEAMALLPGADPAAANPDSALVLPTGLGEARNVLVVAAAHAVVGVGGSWGTLSEVALACRRGIPVVTLHGWTVHAAGGPPPGSPRGAATAEEAVRLVVGLLARPAEDHRRGPSDGDCD